MPKNEVKADEKYSKNETYFGYFSQSEIEIEMEFVKEKLRTDRDLVKRKKNYGFNDFFFFFQRLPCTKLLKTLTSYMTKQKASLQLSLSGELNNCCKMGSNFIQCLVNMNARKKKVDPFLFFFF